MRFLANRWFMHPPETFSLRAFMLVVLVLSALGIGARGFQFARNDSLTMDECALCRDVNSLKITELARPLYHDQAAPLGFLIVQKVIVTTLGIGDRSVRIVPFISGLMTIPLILVTALSIFNPTLSPCAAILVIGLTCFNWGIIDYSAVAKQYTLESVVTLLMLWALAASGSTGNTSAPSTKARAFLILSPSLIWFSYGAIFVTAAIAATLIARGLVLRRREAVRIAVLFALSGVIQMLLFYTLSIRPAAANSHLLSFWFGSSHPPWSPHVALIWLSITFVRMGEILIHARLRSALLLGIACVLLAIFVLVTINAAYRFDWLWIAMIVSVLLCMAASAMRRYPFQDRLLIFLVPIFIFICGRAVELIEQQARIFGAVTVGILLWVAVLMIYVNGVANGGQADNVRSAYRQMVAHMKFGDRLLVTPLASQCFLYYEGLYGLPFGIAVDLLEPNEKPKLSPGRTWLFATRTPWEPGEDEALLVDTENRTERVESSFDAERTTARLYVIGNDR